MPPPEELAEDWWHEGDEVDDDTPPPWFAGQHLPEGAQLMGLTHHVPEGALLDFAGSLDGTKAVHRYTAWFMLIVFGMPVVFAIMRVLDAFIGG